MVLGFHPCQSSIWNSALFDLVNNKVASRTKAIWPSNSISLSYNSIFIGF